MRRNPVDLLIFEANLEHKLKNPHAVALGRLGGKANAGIPKPKSAENGKKGGRPKKS